MQVTAATKTAEGERFAMDNGDSLLFKSSVTYTGNPCAYPVYVFANGRTYSARTGRFAAKTIHPAMNAMRRWLAAQ